MPLSREELVQNVTRVRTSGWVNNAPKFILSSRRALGNLISAQAQILFQIWPSGSVPICFIIFQCPSLNGCVNLAKIVDAGVFWAGARFTDEIRQRDRSEERENSQCDKKCEQGTWVTHEGLNTMRRHRLQNVQ